MNYVLKQALPTHVTQIWST